VGLISGLLLLPLAPVRGTVWVAEQILEQAEREYYDEGGIQARLMEVEEAREAGTIAEDDAAEAEEELIARLIDGRARGVSRWNG
jgi:hypothetical protein